MDKVVRYILGDIVLSDNPGNAMKKWRKLFNIQQNELSKHMDITPSVISDYESGRRKNPGVSIVKKYVLSLIDIDKEKGGKTVNALKRLLDRSPNMDAILSIKEYPKPIPIDKFIECIDGELIVGNINGEIYGHTVVDSIKAILEMSGEDFYNLYGWTTERALIFTNVSSGRSPLVAIRVSLLKPKIVVLQGLRRIDKLAIKLAEVDGIPVIKTELEVDELINRLNNLVEKW
ncbi:helix-turn-helix domain-containing protein [Methanocaldococcus indicus]|uniref:helix-turn-helix domain-containing protein n=1 Tax=Methanocaldococcus indicus TaxID=213231 RepID=UPI003C6CC872